MLRAGYSSDSVMRDLGKRHFADTLDATKETMLIQSGATPKLVNALKTGICWFQPEEAARVKEELLARLRKRALLAEQSQKLDTVYQDQLARQRQAALQSFQSANTAYDYLKGCLVQLSHSSGFTRASDDRMGRRN